MKILTKTLFATVLTATILTSSAITTFAANNIKPPVPSVTAPITFNKISVSGNVKVVLIQNGNEEVRVDEDFNPQKTSITKKGYTLMISSTEKYPVTVTVSVKDLQRIKASDNASVVTVGKLDVACLQIFLNDNASASVKTNTKSLYTVLKDEAVLKLSGKADEHTIVAYNATNANLNDFICQKTDKLTTEPIASR